MNSIISYYAWSPALITLLSFGLVLYAFIKGNPKLILATGIFVVIYFALNLYSAGLIAKAAKCERFDEGQTSGCILFNQDISKGMGTFAVVPWFGMFILPIGFFYIAAGSVMLLGWLTILKYFGYLMLGFFILMFFQALMKK